MKKQLFIILSASVFLARPSEASIKIIAAKNDKPVVGSELQLGSTNFLSFLRCSEKMKQKDIETCADNFFSKNMSQALFRQYLELLRSGSEFSGPFECSDHKKNLIKNLETSKYDSFLCFRSNIVSMKYENIVFFVNERGMPRIIKLKI
jgi:hypothetical protein